MYQASFNDGLVYNVSITLNALNKGSPSPSAERNGIHLKPSKNSSVPAFHTTDSGSNPSSCNSSTPSSPTTMRYTPSPANTQNLTTFTFPGKQINMGVERRFHLYVLYLLKIWWINLGNQNCVAHVL